jgi:Domain of Unknown Function (DUF1206)
MTKPIDPKLKLLARYGSASIGALYMAIGVIAMLSLMGLKDGGADEDSLLELLNSAFVGQVFLWLILLGILSYMVWRVFEAVTDRLQHGKTWKGLCCRAGIILAAGVYGLVAWSGIQAMLGMEDDAEGFEEQRQFIAGILEWNGGVWLIGMAGVVVAITGILEFRYMWKGDHKPQLDIDHLSKTKRLLIHGLAWAGHTARAIILWVIGYSLVRGAVLADAEETVNTDKAFNFIGESMLGHPLFVLVALGTICYGLYMIVYAMFMRMDRRGRRS